MRFTQIVRAWLLILGLALARLASGADGVILGPPPIRPTDVSGWPRGASPRDVTGGFTVNTLSRERARSFYNAVYTSSDSVAINTTANVADCAPGTNSTLYQDAVARRINWFRAMAGIPAAVTLDATESAEDQAGALMMAANNNLSHSPPTSWSCYTFAGATAASNSNLALGNAGADAITAYIQDPGGNNGAAGHRRWLLYPQTQVMATGDVPEENGHSSANATWIFDSHVFGPRPATRNPYVAWPPPGFVPYSVVFPQWSFALSNADLSAATVSMQSNGVSVAVALQPYQQFFGENTLVWVPMGLDAIDGNVLFPFSGADTVYSVTVTNITAGGKIIGFTYTTTLFDPAVAGADYAPTAITGPAQPIVNTSNVYSGAPANSPGVTGYQWIVSQSVSGNLFDGAEAGLSNFSAEISPGYSAVTNGLAAAGTSSFYLAHSTNGGGPTDQTLQLNSVLVPTANAQLSFQSLLGYAAAGEIAEVQVSADEGASWQNIFYEPGTRAPQASYTGYSLSLASYAGEPVWLRFNYHYASGSFYNQLGINPPVGWFIDNILLTNVSQLVNFTTNTTASTNFTFTPTQPGTFNLQAQPIIFNQFPLTAGPILQVTAVAGAMGSIVMGLPLISSGFLQMPFSVAGLASPKFELLQSTQILSGWTSDPSAVLTTNTPGASYTFSIPLGGGQGFYKIKTP